MWKGKDGKGIIYVELPRCLQSDSVLRYVSILKKIFWLILFILFYNIGSCFEDVVCEFR